MSLNVTIRLKLTNQPGTLAQVLAVIAAEGGNLGSIDLVSATSDYKVRELMVWFNDQEDLVGLINALEKIPGVQVMQVADRVFIKHLGGKIEIKAKRDIHGREDLGLVYTPGVARVSRAIANDPETVYRLTMKGNSVAIVTDGTAVLGLGNVGPQAALPVMEGKAVLFKKFAGIDAIPLCLNVHSVKEIVDTVAACAPAFGGINLEDIAAPRCFAIEEELSRRLDIPVFHDDQHGTAVVTVAGLLNALRVVNKRIDKVKIVVSGAGAAGVAITRMLLSTGARHIVVCDSKGAISRDNMPEIDSKKWLALHTNERCVHGSLREVIQGADVFIGVSAPGLLHRDDVLRMAEKPVVFALANPEPEVEPREILDIAGVIATGRSDFPNQINNVLAFPGIFRGALDCHARMINNEMCLAAARVLADMVTPEQLSPEYIIPSVFNEEVCPAVARAVQQAARSTGVSRRYLYEDNEQGKLLNFATT
ncbi:NAD-dependent malic enzyme [Desulfallas thermosapovorans]|uniref:Malate dehydrogenase (Oxaloacetate-decarboxylating) n=1 Tax=Desulfallas thermosapovorans DSM 6562 TaxID=1121431 RepID=A0A5S4ZRH9_9FIRM|nr:NAD-dependent malic enzyme [Desulfallas thermosapovorans]TYO95413.1 malate dehydrogenase (oxaloacetate-decarboxylating) [Desulfallas thermosapovorans DSM 6562]